MENDGLNNSDVPLLHEDQRVIELWDKECKHRRALRDSYTLETQGKGPQQFEVRNVKTKTVEAQS